MEGTRTLYNITRIIPLGGHLCVWGVCLYTLEWGRLIQMWIPNCTSLLIQSLDQKQKTTKFKYFKIQDRISSTVLLQNSSKRAKLILLQSVSITQGVGLEKYIQVFLRLLATFCKICPMSYCLNDIMLASYEYVSLLAVILIFCRFIQDVKVGNNLAWQWFKFE